jgi:hypothetical protein
MLVRNAKAPTLENNRGEIQNAKSIQKRMPESNLHDLRIFNLITYVLLVIAAVIGWHI